MSKIDRRGDELFVTVGLGGRDHVEPEIEFRLSRGTSFVGFAKVTRVEWDHSIAKFDSEFIGRGAPPREGDRVYFR